MRKTNIFGKAVTPITRRPKPPSDEYVPRHTDPVVQASFTDNASLWAVTDCPYCGGTHYHGAEAAHRVRHCLSVGDHPIGAGYWVKAPKRKQRSRKRPPRAEVYGYDINSDGDLVLVVPKDAEACSVLKTWSAAREALL